MVSQFANTPEALLGRNDSKNPSTTCKGITSSGRPCRRALASSRAANGVVGVVEEDGAVTNADFYCWQHKDQAERLVDQGQNGGSRPQEKKRKHSAKLFPLQERSSIDTLVQKLGIEAMPEKTQKKPKEGEHDGVKPSRRTDTADWAQPRPDVGKLSSNAQYHDKYHSGASCPERRNSRKAKKQGFWTSLCCVSGRDEDYVEIVRRRRRMEQRPRPQQASTASVAPVPVGKEVGSRPELQRGTSSNAQTGHLMSFIPAHLSPQTTSTLFSELTKPISPADEDGYIYIFWLTPQSKTAPAESTARSLLIPPSSRPQNARRISDVLTEYSYDGSEETSRGFGSRAGKKKTIMLKIGRANNITRRMNEWQRQCGYALNLVRWYPYMSPSSTPASPQPSPSPHRGNLYPDLSKPPTPRRESGVVHKVPFVKRVERLIHLELADQQVKRQCTACRKEHREWFEIDASQEGIKAVDACVRRWVEWSEREAASRQ